MIDLPLAHVLAEPPGREAAYDEVADTARAADPRRAEAAARIRRDPIAWLAEAAGHGDAERFWEDVVEHRGGEQAFTAIADAMAALRDAAEPGGGGPGHQGAGPAGPHEARREAQMRQAIRQAMRAGHERVAVVCGAWHAPALATPGPPPPPPPPLKRLPTPNCTPTP